jgi:hypothetical protein
MSNLSFHNFLPPNFARFPSNNLNLLGLGSKFCPRPVEPNFSVYSDAFSSFIRRFRVLDYFKNCVEEFDSEPFDPRFKSTSDWNPPFNTDVCNQICSFIENFQRSILVRSSFQRQCSISRKLKEFLRNKFIKVVSSDKNLGLCIFTIEDYHKMVSVHLSDDIHYLRIGSFSSGVWKQILQSVCRSHAALLKRFDTLFPLSRQISKFLHGSERRLPVFNVLPKLHKKSVSISSRPIVGAVSWITTRWSIYLCSVLETISCPFTLSNSLSLISRIEGQPVSNNCFFVTADVSSLYTMMSVPRLFNCLRSKNVSEFDISIATFVCNSNYFKYGSTVYKQLDGIAMGCNAAVHFANIYLDSFDQRFAPLFKFYCRYIDDLFFIFEGPEFQLQSIFNQMNAFIPDIHLSFHFSTVSVNFLDLKVFKYDHKVCFKTFQKAFNIYQYLPPFSLHPPACISGFIKGELIRFVRSNTLLSDRFILFQLFRKRLLARGYSQAFLSKIFASVDISTRRPVSLAQRSRLIIPLVVPFYPNLITQRCKYLALFLNEHFMDPSSGYRFLVSFKRCPNLLQLCHRSNISREQEEHLKTSRQVHAHSSAVRRMWLWQRPTV